MPAPFVLPKKGLFMKLLVLLSFVAVSLLFSSNARAQMARPQVFAQESGVYKDLLMKNDELLYNMSWTYTKTTEGGKNVLVYQLKGDNGKKGADRIDWTEDAKLEEVPTGYRTLYWKKSSTGAEQMDWELKYDWAAHKAYYKYADRATGKKESKTLSFGDAAIPGDALYLVLRGFPFEKGAGTSMKGEVVNGDGTVLKGEIIHRGEENLATPQGTIAVYKLELKPTGLVGMLPTKLYIYMAKEAPHHCVRFDGLEGISRTKTVLYNYSAK